MALDKRQIGATSMLLGNAAVFANGLIALTQSKDKTLRTAGASRMSSAVLTSGASIIMGRYSNPSISRQLTELEGKLAAYLKVQGVPLDPKTLRKADAETRKSWFAKLEDYAYAHPVECSNIYNAVSSLGMLGSGILRLMRGEREAATGNILNSLLVISGAFASLIPERTHEQVVKSGHTGLWGKIQERPLNLAMVPFVGADLSYGWTARGEFKEARQMSSKHDPFGRWMFAMSGLSAFTLVAATTADLLIGSGSKKSGGVVEERSTAQEQLIASTASILAQQPKEMQAALVHKAAEYLAHQHGLRMVDFDTEKLAERIQAAMAEYGEPTTAQRPERFIKQDTPFPERSR